MQLLAQTQDERALSAFSNPTVGRTARTRDFLARGVEQLRTRQRDQPPGPKFRYVSWRSDEQDWNLPFLFPTPPSPLLQLERERDSGGWTVARLSRTVTLGDLRRGGEQFWNSRRCVELRGAGKWSLNLGSQYGEVPVPRNSAIVSQKAPIWGSAGRGSTR